MPKLTKYPRLRTKVYKGVSGQAYVYYVYDMRPDGLPDIRLGRDHAKAIEQWDQLHNKKPRTIGRLQEAFDRWRERELPGYESIETRKGYARNLANIEPVFGQMVWDEVTLPILREYLARRSAKTQGNREMSVLQIIWSKALMWGMTRQPWPAAGVKGWKNKETARQFEVTDELFGAVYAQASPMLRDCMDIATATGMRLSDVRTIRMPVNGLLRFKSLKTGKLAEFEVSASPVLTELVQRREALKAHSVMLLCTPTGRQVTARMLRSHYDAARDQAIDVAIKAKNQELADSIRAMYLRDMRSRAADLADDIGQASKLLQHSSQRLTQAHYRTRPDKLKAVR